MNGLRGMAWLLVFQSVGELLSRGLSLPLPGPVLGMMLMLGGAALRRRARAGGRMGELLLAHLSLLFVPVGVGVMTHLALLGRYGGRMLLVIALSTWIGLAVTALVLYWPATAGKRCSRMPRFVELWIYLSATPCSAAGDPGRLLLANAPCARGRGRALGQSGAVVGGGAGGRPAGHRASITRPTSPARSHPLPARAGRGRPGLAAVATARRTAGRASVAC